MSIHISGVVLQVIICDPAARRLEPVALRVYFVSPFLCSLHIKRVFVRHAFSVLVQHKFPFLGFTKKSCAKLFVLSFDTFRCSQFGSAFLLVVLGGAKSHFPRTQNLIFRDAQKTIFRDAQKNTFRDAQKKTFSGTHRKQFSGTTRGFESAHERPHLQFEFS